MICPRCGSDYIVKNGISLSRKQKYKCRECDKQFVLNLEKKISEEKKAIIDKLLGSDQKLEVILRISCLFSCSYKIYSHLNLIATLILFAF